MISPACRSRLTAAAIAAAAVLGARPVLAEECQGVSMPDRIDVGGETLVLNGMGTREATVLNVDVYVAGLYLPERTRYASAALDGAGTKRIVLQLVRDVKRGEMSEALREGLQRNAGGRMDELAQRADRLERLIPDLNDGDTIAFTHSPAGGGALLVEVDGRERGRIEGSDFARAFFAIWLGKPPNEALKSGLLGGGCE